MKTGLRLSIAAFVLAAFNVSAATLYVSLDSPSPTSPFASWATAATNIQQAVDAAQAGDTVRVTNGVYRVGQREVSILFTNEFEQQEWVSSSCRVAVTDSIRLESINGPLATLIEGSTALTNEFGEVVREGGRCAYVGTNAVLSGFTLTNGSAFHGAGAYCEPGAVVTNCVLTGNSGTEGGGAYGGTLLRCRLIDNRAWYGWLGCLASGGGAANCALSNCTLTGNSATAPQGGMGGGAANCTLYHCTLTSNSASGKWLESQGGGAYLSTLNNCELSGNSATNENAAGGGAYGCVLYHCRLRDNRATGWSLGCGGGATLSMLYNCTVSGNSATGQAGSEGGGASGCILYNCTLIHNSAEFAGGASWDFFGSGGQCILLNSIVYDNPGGNYDVWAELHYCCTDPLPTNGVGNICGPPLFIDMAAGDFRLREDSPCIDAGTNLLGMSFTKWNGTWTSTGEPDMVVDHNTDARDILGDTRFIDGNFDGRAAWDLGAFEFNPYRFESTLRVRPEGFQFTVRGEPGKSVRVERSRDLLGWETVATVPIPTAGQTVIDPAATTEPFLFYRAVSVP